MENNTAGQNFQQTGLTLPPAPAPVGVYKTYIIDGKNLYVSGHWPINNDGSLMKGRVGKDVNEQQGKLAAQQVGLAILATIESNLGSLDKVKRVLKVLGMVNCVPEFENHPYVINGCSELFKKVWGENNGVGVRSAVGMESLPGNISVEIEAMFELF